MESNNFSNKKILFISVKLFNYENIIADKMRSLGAIVDYFDERPANSILAKGIIRLKRDFYNNSIVKYYNSILVKLKDVKYDYFFLIKGEVIPQFFIDRVKELNPSIVLLYYTFDSFLNNPNGVMILDSFDRKFTFDSKDAQDYKIRFRPLFFSDDYMFVNEDFNPENDLLFVGTAHSDRYIISEFLSDWCTNNNLKSYTFYYSPSRIVFLFFKFFDPSFKKFIYNKITFKSLEHRQIIDLYKQSKVILDINHPNQNGLTMRVFEALGSGKKIITTNEEIKRYPFYNTNNIFVIDRKNIKIDKAFFQKPFQKISTELYQNMSIKGWLEELFFNHNTNDWLDGGSKI